MIANPQNRTFTLADGRQVTIVFFRPNRFGHTLRDHVLDETESALWNRVLHLRVKRQENLRQQLAAGAVSERDAAEEEVYPQCVEVLAAGISYSIGVPVYVEFVQERRKSLSDPAFRTRGFYFLAEAGFLVVVRDDVVRTARFEAGIKGGLSRVGLFREAWKHVQTRITRVSEYLDSKDQEYVRHAEVRRWSEENWVCCPV
jgi:hypothetical protein